MTRRGPALATAAVILGVAVGGGVARAGGPQPRSHRDGFAIGLALGPSLFKGTGDLDPIQGVGGDFQLRLGTAASENLLWMIELEYGNEVVQVIGPGGTPDTTRFNTLGRLSLGLQYYPREALWLRGGIGAASFVAKDSKNGPADESTRRSGLAVSAGGGVDVFRRGSFAVDLELCLTASVLSSSFLGHAAGMVGVAWY